MQYSGKYIFFFTTGLCLICSLMISLGAVGLRERQEANVRLDKKQSVLQACRLLEQKERGKLSAEEIDERFKVIEPKVIALEDDWYVPDLNPEDFNEDEAEMVAAGDNVAKIPEVPTQVKIFHLKDDGAVQMIILPIYGKGLWGTMRGYLALNADTTTIEGIIFYEHKETPGLGGEVNNPKWKSLWPGRKVYDEDWKPAIRVIKGRAGSPQEAPHEVDGLSGATITGRGVTNMLSYWLGEEGFGPYLKRFRESGSV